MSSNRSSKEARDVVAKKEPTCGAKDAASNQPLIGETGALGSTEAPRPTVAAKEASEQTRTLLASKLANKSAEESQSRALRTAKKLSQDDEESHEDRADFELLSKQLSQASQSTGSTSSLSSGGQSEIWPLQLNVAFIENYIFGDVIGRGSYAEVRECIDSLTLERCAVKIVSTRALKKQAPRALANQLQEIFLLRRLNHPNIIKLKDRLLKEDKIYIVLEHCSLVLQDLLQQQPEKRFCVQVSRDLFTQLILGLDYLHSQGIIHRDIKPHNLLLTNCGTLKIIDFGVSHLLSLWTRSDECANYEGSPLFQAPEVVTGQATYAGFKVDVWSAGVTLYSMLYGVYPFYEESLLALYDKILLQQPLIPPSKKLALPSQSVLTDLLGSMLDKKASRRISIEQIFEHPWLRHSDHYEAHDMHSDLIDLLSSPTPTSRESGAQSRDIYRSTTTLPYLYNYHFPHLPVVKAKRSASNASSSRTTSEASSSGAWTTPPASPCSENDPHAIIDELPVEWGTEAQYKLLKLPQIRSNRVLARKSLRRRAKKTLVKTLSDGSDCSQMKKE